MEQMWKGHLSRPNICAVVPPHTHAENMQSDQICLTHSKDVPISCSFEAHIWHPRLKIIIHRNRWFCSKPISDVKDKKFLPKSYMANSQHWHGLVMIRTLTNKLLSSLRDKCKFTSKLGKKKLPSSSQQSALLCSPQYEVFQYEEPPNQIHEQHYTSVHYEPSNNVHWQCSLHALTRIQCTVTQFQWLFYWLGKVNHPLWR